MNCFNLQMPRTKVRARKATSTAAEKENGIKEYIQNMDNYCKFYADPLQYFLKGHRYDFHSWSAGFLFNYLLISQQFDSKK